MDMKAYGLTDRFLALAGEYPNWTPGRIVSQEKGQYRIVTEFGEKQAEVSGKLRYQAMTPSDYPAVGDFVMADWNQHGDAVIHQLLHRKSCFIRKAAGAARQEQVVASNIDTVFLCMALNNDFNLRRLERYLTIAWDSGAKPVVVLTKADLCDDLSGRMLEVEGVAVGADILVTSAVETEGYGQILPYIHPGETIALMGSSGVGKSTLINALVGENRMQTNGLRNDDKGRHTTTHRELILLPGGGMVIDTPGMRELGMWDSAGGLSQTFGDIEELASSCRFRNCTHSGEPGCAVSKALLDGTLTEERWQSYQKLSKETGYAADSESYLVAKEKKFKQIAKINKNNRKR